MSILLCSNSDHDVVGAPATVTVTAENGSERIELARCDYCVEGAVARFRRSGWARIVIEAVSS